MTKTKGSKKPSRGKSKSSTSSSGEYRFGKVRRVKISTITVYASLP